MKKTKRKSLLERTIRTNYDVAGEGRPHSPSMTIENLKRRDRILEKMRKAGITEDEIHFLVDFYQADMAHVLKLSAASDDFEAEKNSAN